LTAFVLDASTALAWCFKDEDNNSDADRAQQLLADATALVPRIWHAEVANGLVAGERRKRIDWPDLQRSVALLETLDIRIDLTEIASRWMPLIQLARSHRLSLYDAIYLDLAMREHLPLATVDTALARAAEAAGVALI
jgi:predicted nucleic acid-binding protein